MKTKLKNKTIEDLAKYNLVLTESARKNFRNMTPTQRTTANCCLIFSISTAIILTIASALIFMRS